MAKVNAPLLSFEARGQIAKAAVYFPWKGINAVRQYVIPANPKSDAQIVQRDYMKDAVTEWHGMEPSGEDVTAWNRYSGVLAKIMSGFNAFCKSHLAESILGGTWERLHHISTDTVEMVQFGVGIYKSAAGNAPTLYWGTRKTHFPNSIAMTDGGDGTWHQYATGLVKDTLYYFYIDVGSAGADYGRTGIAQQRTAAA